MEGTGKYTPRVIDDIETVFIRLYAVHKQCVTPITVRDVHGGILSSHRIFFFDLTFEKWENTRSRTILVVD